MRSSIFLAACALAFAMTTTGPALARPIRVANPCNLVTLTEVKTALGAAPTKPQLLSAGLYQSCSYKAGHTGLVLLVRRISKSNFAKSAKANPKPVVPVSGIGESAYSVGGGAGLLVWSNGTEATFTIFGANNTLQREEQLARKAVAKL